VVQFLGKIHFFLLILLTVSSLQAATVNVQSITASSNPGSYPAEHLIDGSGLYMDGGNLVHDNNWQNMWISEQELQATLIFEFDETYLLEAISVWNFGWNAHPTAYYLRGVQDFELYSSTDGSNYSIVGSYHLDIEDGSPIDEQIFILNDVVASHIKLQILDNYGDPYNYSGLSEVQFKGSIVPIPAAVWLFGSALAGLGWMRRNKLPS
jgi:hypothetical protein